MTTQTEAMTPLRERIIATLTELSALTGRGHPQGHAYDRGSRSAERTLARIVCLADVLSKSLGYGFAQPSPVDPARFPCLEQLGLSPDAIPQVLTDLAATYTEEQNLFKG